MKKRAPTDKYDCDYFEKGGKGSCYLGYSEDVVLSFWLSQLEYFIKRSMSILRKPLNSMKWLDIGCAKGYLVSELRRRCIEAYGVDISKYAIQQSPTEVKPYPYCIDICEDEVPFLDTTFDVILMLE